MPKMFVNVDRFTWPTKDGRGLHAANRGEIVDLPAEEAERGRNLLTTNGYTVAGVSVTREEPVLIPAGDAEKHAVSAQRAVADARREQLEREMAELDVVAPRRSKATPPPPPPAP